jgi:Leucine-rich repeat (LRR) protein
LFNLELAFFQQNNIRAIPLKIGRVTKIKKLDLSENKIKEIPDAIGMIEDFYCD